MKTLTNDEIMWMIDHCGVEPSAENEEPICQHCPFDKECYYYYTGDPCGSVLEVNDK